MTTEFAVTTKVLSGVGSLAGLDAEMAAFGQRRWCVVADEGIAETNLLAHVTAPIASRVAATVLVPSDPDVAAAERAAGQAIEAGSDAVLAVGGGSALGAAKAVAIRLTNPGRIDQYQGVDRVPTAPAPTVAVPTTAGSGSEVSMVLVLHEPGRKDELVVRTHGCEPAVAILDATVLRGLPLSPLVFAALDALSHGLESQWAKRASLFTRSLGLAAAREIVEVLPGVVDGARDGRNVRGENDEALQRLLEASSAANMACGNSGLTLVHALSTAPSVHIPHGEQNGILLPHVAEFNRIHTSEAVAALVDRLPDLYARIGFTATLRDHSVGAAEVAAMVEASTGHPFRINNLRPSTDDELVALLARAGADLERTPA